MNRLIMTVGLPRSGKTTWAKAQNLPIVCPDAIRLALHGQRFQLEAEAFVWAIAHCMVKALFLAGNDRVILDATNGTKRRRKEWESDDYIREYQVFDTTPAECVHRAQATNDSYILPVIERMAAQWEPVEDDERDE